MTEPISLNFNCHKNQLQITNLHEILNHKMHTPKEFCISLYNEISLCTLHHGKCCFFSFFKMFVFIFTGINIIAIVLPLVLLFLLALLIAAVLIYCKR